MKAIAPVISSSVAGPLGVLHLPRLWLKVLLHACGRLPEGYRYGAGGFDELLCDRLGLDREAFVAWIVRDRPDYCAVERYVVEHAADLAPNTIAAFNTRVRAGEMNESTAAERRARFGITEASFANAIALNDLDDWALFHEELLAAES